MSERTWHGDWLVRIYQRVSSRGFPSVAAFAEATQTATLVELARALGDDVAATQVESALRAEAQRTGELGRFARDLLARTIRWHLPKGWDDHEQFAFDRSGVYVDWPAGLNGLIDGTTCTALMDSLKRADIPNGWLPTGPDDPIIEHVFAGIPIESQPGESQIGIIEGMGRLWPGDWDLVVMGELQTLEQRLGRRLQQEEILEVVGALMKKYDIDKPFEPLAGATHE